MRQRMYRGNNVSQSFLDWLNTTTDTAAKERVLALLEAMQQFPAESRPRRRALLFQGIANALAEYRPRFGIRWEASTNDWSEHWTLRGTEAEGSAVSALLDLHRDRVHHRVRRCSCGTWFLVRTKRNTFCSRPCQLRANRSTLAWKKKNRKHQRAWRKRNFQPRPPKKHLRSRTA